MSVKTRCRSYVVLAAIAGLVAATPAHANAGTGMVWLGMAHLFIGNALIGLLEWGVLHALLRTFWRKGAAGTGIIIGANYVSAWLGVVLLVGVWPRVIGAICPQPLVQARGIIAVSWVILFALTILIEWPFVHWMVNGGERRWSRWRVLRATALINVVSYVLLVPLYYGVTPISLATQMRVVPAPQIAGTLKARVYYLNPTGDLWEMRVDGSQQREVARLGLHRLSELVLFANPKTGMLDVGGLGDPPWCAVRGAAKVPRFADDPAGSGDNHRPRYNGHEPGRHGGYALDLRPVGQTSDTVVLGTWAAEGVIFGPTAPGRPGRRLRLALETPFLALTPCNGTVLPGDRLVLEYSSMFGGPHDQIVLLDLPGRRLAVLVAGRSPVVVLDELPAGVTWWRPQAGAAYNQKSSQFRLKGATP
jgi:hypothetical protein